MSATNTNRVSHFSATQKTGQSFENPILVFGCFSLKAVYNSSKLQRLLQFAKYLFTPSISHTTTVFLFRHLPTEIVIFINVCYQKRCFSGDSFSLFEQVLLIFHLLFWFHVKLQRLLQVAKFLFMYSFTTLLFRHRLTEIVIFINVCSQIKCFSGDSFSFFEEQILLTFHLLFWFHVKFKQGIQRH